MTFSQIRVALRVPVGPHLAERVAAAREAGFDGIELAFGSSEPGPIDTGGMPAACISSDAIAGDPAAEGRIQKLIDVAQTMKCDLVHVRDIATEATVPVSIAAGKLAELAGTLADYATEHGVAVAIENALVLRTAKAIWLAMESLQHPDVCVAWNVLAAMRVGERPSISIPVLNSRIGIVLLADARIEGNSATACDLGKGQVPVADLLWRLRGIGYSGWISYTGGNPSEALAMIRNLIAPPKPPEVKKEKPAAKAAATAPAASA